MALFLLRMTWVSISSVGISWSEIPGMICCLFIRSGMLVKNRSRMFDELVSVLVGSMIIWDRPLSFTISRRRLHCCRLLADGDGAPMYSSNRYVLSCDLKTESLGADLRLSGRLFHRRGPAALKAHCWIADDLVKGTTNRFFSLDRNPLHGTCGWSSSCRYTGARLLTALYTRTRVLNLILCLTGRQ